MVIDKLTLHNFGIYSGRHEIKLTPVCSKKPITLFGALNGGGKTTFLDALLLVLYGKFAKCANRGNLSYDEFLRKSINRHISEDDGASVELEFRHRQSRVEESIRIARTWRSTGKGIREDIAVFRNGQLDPECTDRWYEFIEELIPSRIANLFFFDGEKIEDLATPEHASELIRTGVHALLGLDLINTLEQDLKVLERRRKARLGNAADQNKLQLLTEEFAVLERTRAELCQRMASCQSDLDALGKEKRKLEQSYKDQGGDLFDQRKSIMDAHERATRELIGVRDRMRSIAASDAPLLLIENLIQDAYEQCVKDKEVLTNSLSLDILTRRDSDLLEHLRSIHVARSMIEPLVTYLNEDRLRREKLVSNSAVIGVEPEAFSFIRAGRLDDTRNSIQELLLHTARLENEVAALDRRLESIPDPAGLVGISQKLAANEKKTLINEHKFLELGEESDQVSSAINRKQVEIDNLLDAQIRSQFSDERSERVIIQSEVTRSILSDYRTRLCESHIERLERLVLDSYRRLMRKRTLVCKLKIDAKSFELTMYADDNKAVPLERLSAGERQLLATAILWGLSKASGRPLPMVIDTPLGRLDGFHRANLVSHYFPLASHQVILLSTDKEIDAKNYSLLSPVIGREYSILYDEESRSSKVVDGYLWKASA